MFGAKTKTALHKFVMQKGREAGNIKSQEPKREASADKRTGKRLPLPKGRVYS